MTTSVMSNLEPILRNSFSSSIIYILLSKILKPPHQFSGLTEFKPKIVDLSENRFTNVTVIADLTIEVLNLSRCSIEFIETASFRDLQEMRVLDLSHNQLTTAKLSPHAFEVTWSSAVLFLACYIKFLCYLREEG